MNKNDQTSLLNLMEAGILSELKHRQRRTTQLKTWVFASCNSTEKLLAPLITRFTVMQFKPYTEEEFVEIVVNVLDREEGLRLFRRSSYKAGSFFQLKVPLVFIDVQ
jgi:hypothetical protein